MKYINKRYHLHPENGTGDDAGEGAATSQNKINSFCSMLRNELVSDLDGVSHYYINSIPTTMIKVGSGLRIGLSSVDSGTATAVKVSVDFGHGSNVIGNVGVTQGRGQNYTYDLGVHAAYDGKTFALILRSNSMANYSDGKWYDKPDFNISIFYSQITGGAVCGYTAATPTTSTTRNFAIDTVLYDCSSGNAVYAIPTRLPYQGDNDIRKIDYISNEKKIAVLNGIKSAQVGDLIDCATVIGDQFYPIGSKVYYAINDNTLMEV